MRHKPALVRATPKQHHMQPSTGISQYETPNRLCNRLVHASPALGLNVRFCRNESYEPGTWTDPGQTSVLWQVKCAAMLRERLW
jgi:hypothetical protein